MSNSKNNQFMHGSPLLIGDNTIPGLKLPKEIDDLIPRIMQECHDFGLDFYPTVVQMLTYDDISEVAAYGGFPVRFPHWKWGMEYEELQRGFEHNNYRIYEMVVNTDPCYIYCLDSNSLVDNVTVIAHALGHNDYFKNNIYFSKTSQNMMNELANHGTRIRRYIARWGKERVTEFIDHCLRIDTLIDPGKAWDTKTYKDPIVFDSRKYRHAIHIDAKDGHDYMDGYLNPDQWIEDQQEEIRRKEVAEYLELFKAPTRDIMGFIRDHGNLKPWQADILSMLYEESIYFSPQRMTKIGNEGWASYVDFHMMAKRGLVGLGQTGHDCGIIDYAVHKMGVLGGKYSMNPYKLGFTLFNDIEDRWNKGKFGAAYENCQNMQEKADWDLKLGKGHEKVLEVRKFYNDFTMLAEFFTEEFCNDYEFFEWKHYPNGETKIESRDYKKIRDKLIRRAVNGGLPEIKLTDPNFRNRNELMLEHVWEGRTLLPGYTTATLQSLAFLWGKVVHLATRNKDGKEVVYTAWGPDEDDIEAMTRKEFERGGKEEKIE